MVGGRAVCIWVVGASIFRRSDFKVGFDRVVD
jgi:hypothetical protein